MQYYIHTLYTYFEFNFNDILYLYMTKIYTFLFRSYQISMDFSF